MQWFYLRAGAQHGPVEEAEIKRLIHDGVLGPHDLVWNAAMGGEWKRTAEAGLIAEAADGRVLPPVIPSTGLRPGPPSVVIPVGEAWRQMTGLLFAPFAMGKWFLLGFSAWLASLGEGGGSSSNLGSVGDLAEARDDFGGVEDEGVSDGSAFGGIIERARDFWSQHSDVVIGVGVVVVLLVLVVGILILWLKSRGRFMFLDNVVNNRADIAEPWKRHRRLGHSLFFWSLAYSAVCLVVGLAILAYGVFAVLIPCIEAQDWVPAVLPAIIMGSLLCMFFGLVAAYIELFLDDFVVPIMYRNEIAVGPAWKQFLGLLSGNFWRFILYGVFRMVLAAGFGMALLLIGLATCCIGLLLMATPYIRAVVTLPVLVFFRCYSLAYLAQFGPEFEMRPRR